MLEAGLICPKPSFHNIRRANIVLSTAKSWPEAGEEVVQMGGHEPRSLEHSRSWPAHNERHQKHSPREPDDIERDDEKTEFLAPVVLRIRVCNAENEGLRVLAYFCSLQREVLPCVKIAPPKIPPAVNFYKSVRIKCRSRSNPDA